MTKDKLEPCGWGVFWEERGMQCSVLKSSEGDALKFAVDLNLQGASVERVYRINGEKKETP